MRKALRRAKAVRGLERAAPKDTLLPPTPTPALALAGVSVMAKNTAAASDTTMMG